MPDPEDVLSFWSAARAPWLTDDANFDAAVRTRFSNVHTATAAGDCDSWLLTPRGRLAFIIVLDQFSRKMFRGRAESYAWDEHAQAIALDGIDSGDDSAVPTGMRCGFYLPLMHAEDLELQERAVALCEAAGDIEATAVAKSQRALIRRFGRFPDRNHILQRPSTPTELALLRDR